MENNINNPLKAFSDIEGMILAENENIIQFLNAAVFKTKDVSLIGEGVMVYWIIREQARKNKIAGN